MFSRLLRRLLVCGFGLGVAGCGAQHAPPPDGTPITVWATVYRLVDGRTDGGGIPIRSMGGRVIGPTVARSDWCAGALAGSLRVGGEVFNFAGVTGSPQANCSHGPSERVRWQRSPHPYGTGARSNPLHPFRTIACDLGWVGGSTPWVNGGYPEFGQRIYIPAADGVELPDGTVHDGIFICEDTGGAVTGNHIDVFLGPMSGPMSRVIARNPFDFVSHGDHAEVQAFLLPMETDPQPQPCRGLFCPR
ncbi:3D domain-containing protein [Nioella sp.]|uniref:3D domain-containing protein n=1 Tax=Nioella sp. TaxID=1912091 RepID=UPI003B521D31